MSEVREQIPRISMLWLLSGLLLLIVPHVARLPFWVTVLLLQRGRMMRALLSLSRPAILRLPASPLAFLDQHGISLLSPRARAGAVVS